MTISKRHTLFVLSALICVIPVSDAYSGPVASKLWSFAKVYFTYPPTAAQCLSTKPIGKIEGAFDASPLSDNSTDLHDASSFSDDSGSGWFSTKTLLAGAALVAGGYAIYKCYTAYKNREAERKAREEVESQTELKRQQEREATDSELGELMDICEERERLQKKKEEELLKKEEEELLEKEKAKIKAYKKEEKRVRKEERRKKGLSHKVETGCLLHSSVRGAVNDLLNSVENKIEQDDYQDAEIGLSELVKNCSLCNQLTVHYLNELYKDEGKEHKEHVIGFLRGVKELGADQSGWNNRNIMLLINNGGTSFVMDRLEYIAKGEKYVKAITSGNVLQVPQCDQKEYLNSIISITWYFYAKSLQKGDGFSKSASFNIESKSLMNFFMGYCHQARKWHSEYLDTGSSWAAQYAQAGTNKLGDHPFAYERCSSHLKGLNATNYGIDVRFVSDSERGSLIGAEGSWLGPLLSDFWDRAASVLSNAQGQASEYLIQMQDALPRLQRTVNENEELKHQLSAVTSLYQLLPDGKAHLLFIPYNLENGRFLLKPESHGTTVFDLPDAIAHGLEFLHGSKDNDYDYTRREKLKKDVNFKKLQEQYKKIVPGQGEVVDMNTGNKCRSSVDDTQAIRVLGVQHMLERLEHWIGKSKDTRLKKLQALKDELVRLYTDHHDIRFAHEVVFKESDFR